MTKVLLYALGTEDFEFDFLVWHHMHYFITVLLFFKSFCFDNTLQSNKNLKFLCFFSSFMVQIHFMQQINGLVLLQQYVVCYRFYTDMKKIYE